MWTKNGETKQKWETWHTHKEALKRKAEIEKSAAHGNFSPTKQSDDHRIPL